MAAPETLAGVTELADWLGEPIAVNSADEKRAQLCLRIASALVRKESGQTWLATDGTLVDPLPEDAVMVTLYCASRVYDNRTAQTTSGIDDHNERWIVDEAGAYLTASEKAMLSQFKAGSRRGIGVLETTRQDSVPASAGWVPVEDGPLFPWY